MKELAAGIDARGHSVRALTGMAFYAFARVLGSRKTERDDKQITLHGLGGAVACADSESNCVSDRESSAGATY